MPEAAQCLRRGTEHVVFSRNKLDPDVSWQMFFPSAPNNVLLCPCTRKRACFGLLHPQTQPCDIKKFGPTAPLLMLSATKMTFLLNTAWYCSCDDTITQLGGIFRRSGVFADFRKQGDRRFRDCILHAGWIGWWCSRATRCCRQGW